ncbi:hypothetical protein [Marimonas arenosa]|uniref:Uncharacterized protein n=1 Tax=Marimonas arenosa TaxID=1795305 RepID=A0AAE3WJ14_9RHOB|nr:hypothetical protein [Marimonas arenosa]MDQ2092353.1 hypothetical protein [Marimonas arenosa]
MIVLPANRNRTLRQVAFDAKNLGVTEDHHQVVKPLREIRERIAHRQSQDDIGVPA